MMRISTKGLVCLVLLILVVAGCFSGLTHVAGAVSNAQTLFTTQTPALLNVHVAPYELGTEFTSSVSGHITSIRFWKSSSETGQHIGHIWSASGQLLASATFASETASGWQQQSLASPLAIAANTVYVVSVNSGSNAYYAATTTGLATQVINQNLSTVVGNNGLYGTPGQFPTQSYSHSNYFRDIVFSPDPTIFTTQTPALPNVQVGPHELGTEFTSTVSGQITAIRFWKSSSETGQHVGHIWSASGQLLASATFASETASGWQQQSLPSPLAIAANTVYVVSVNTGGIYYAATTSGLTSSVVNQNLSTVVGNNGVYGPTGQFPTQSYSHSNYFRDVVFSPGSSLPPTGGTGQQQISVVPVSVGFGSVTVGTTNTQTVTVGNPGTANLSISQATVSGSGFALSGLTLPLTVAPGNSAAFTVKFAPTAAGSVIGSLTLVSNAPTSPTIIPLRGTGVTVSVQLAASPTSLSYGNVNLGTTSSKTVTLTNSGNSSVSISQLSVSGAGFTASGLTVPSSLSPGQSTTFSVNFAPTAAGSVSGNVSVASNATNSPTQIALTGSGLQPSASTLPLAAFPGAQGGGALTRGGRGGAVYEVTNLNDSGAGSLRACVAASGPRTCVFRTGGHLTLHSQLYVGNPYLTIAGQTAPGGGIELSAKDPNGTAYFNDDLFRIETHDVIVRYVKFRLGYNANASYQNAFQIQAATQYNIMVDHCSIYWGMWDDISTWATGTGSNKNITYSWNIIAEPLLQPGATGTVAVNISAANNTLADASTDIDFHHNLFASAGHRLPLHTVKSGRLVNNVIYNWYYYVLRTKGLKDIIGNYFKSGPETTAPSVHEISAWTTNDGNDTTYAPSFYITGNAGPHNSYNPSTDNWSTLTALACNQSAGECSSPLSTSYQRSTPLATSGVPITEDSATSLATSGGTFLTTVGASQKLNDAACDGTFINNQDGVDTRVVNEFLNGTGTSDQALQYESQVGGFPTLTTGTACTDTGHDGMTDVWELKHGLTPGDPTNATKVAPNGYTYLENYLSGTDPNVAVTY
jgi:hypothetical protein